MITYSFEYPPAWADTMAVAVASWPSALAVWTPGVPDRPDPDVRAWFGSSSLVGATSVPASALATTSIVVGTVPMAPTRLSSWIRRVVLPIAGATDRAALEEWDLGESSRSFPLPSGAGAPSAARTHLRAALEEVVRSRAKLDSERVHDIVLATSELAANAVQHGKTPILLEVHGTDASVAIEMIDGDVMGRPHVGQPEVPSRSGRGLPIVAALAADWGVTVRATTKSVWCELTVIGSH